MHCKDLPCQPPGTVEILAGAEVTRPVPGP